MSTLSDVVRGVFKPEKRNTETLRVFDPEMPRTLSRYSDEFNETIVGGGPISGGEIAGLKKAKRNPTIQNISEHELAHENWANKKAPASRKAFVGSLANLQTAKETGSPSLNAPGTLQDYASQAYTNPWKNYSAFKRPVPDRIRAALLRITGKGEEDPAYNEAYAVLSELYAKNRQQNPFRSHYSELYSEPNPFPHEK